MGLIAVVYLAGKAAGGATRWIDVGFFQFQPSEFGKLLVVLALAGLLAERQAAIGEWSTTLSVLLFGALPTFLVFVQPDLGTALVYMAALAAMLFVAGTPWWHLATLGADRRASSSSACCGSARPSAFSSSRATSRRASRASSIPRSARTRRATTKNSRRSRSARARSAASARTRRRRSTEASFPRSNTDFAFASYAEQRGFVGAVILLALYLLVLWRGLRVVTVARDLFSAVVAGGIVVALFFQIFVNVGMTMGIAPITGIPLPFVSVGGSAMIANLAAMGVLLAIHARGRASRRRRRVSARRQLGASGRGGRGSRAGAA